MGTKADKAEARRLAAIKRDRLKHLIAFSVVIANAWLEGGNEVAGAQYDAVEATPEEMCFVKAQWKKILKHRDDIIARLGLGGMYYPGKKSEEVARKKAFFASADNLIMTIENGVRKYFADASHTDQLKVITYLFYATVHDWWVLHPDEKASDLRYFVQTLGTFADRMVPKDSMLVLPINQIYWETWEALQMETGNVFLHELAEAQSEEEQYIRTTPSPVMRALNDELRWDKLGAAA